MKNTDFKYYRIDIYSYVRVGQLQWPYDNFCDSSRSCFWHLYHEVSDSLQQHKNWNLHYLL